MENYKEQKSTPEKPQLPISMIQTYKLERKESTPQLMPLQGETQINAGRNRNFRIKYSIDQKSPVVGNPNGPDEVGQEIQINSMAFKELLEQALPQSAKLPHQKINQIRKKQIKTLSYKQEQTQQNNLMDAIGEIKKGKNNIKFYRTIKNLPLKQISQLHRSHCNKLNSYFSSTIKDNDFAKQQMWKNFSQEIDTDQKLDWLNEQEIEENEKTNYMDSPQEIYQL